MTVRFFTILTVLTFTAVSLVGCAAADSTTGQDTPTTATSASTTTTVESGVTSPTTTRTLTAVITAAEAEEIALADAGYTADQVTGLHSELDREPPDDPDDLPEHYEVEFRVDTAEYEYKIDSQNGAILERDIDW